jgi:hypothetical protein
VKGRFEALASSRWCGKRVPEQRSVAGQKKDGCVEQGNRASATLHAKLWPCMPAGERIAD